MFKTNLKPRHKVADSKKAVRFAAIALFLFLSILPTQGQTNLVSGTAYGTNYIDLATTNSIESIEDGEGSLLIGYTNTTDLALKHDLVGFIVISNEVADFSIVATTNAVVTSSVGPALTVINATNLSLTGGLYIGVVETGVGGLLRNSTATIDGSEFVGSAGNAGMVVQASDLIITNGSFSGGAGASGFFAVSNSTVTINSGSFTGLVGLAVQTSDLVVNDGSFSGGEGGSGLLAISNSTVTIHGGSYTGRDNTAFYLQDSDATVYDGTFVGNVGGGETLYGDGLFSELTTASTNDVKLYGGTFSSVAFWGVDGSVQNFLAETNLVVQNGIVQNGGRVDVDNQSNDPLQDLLILKGTMAFQNAFTLSSNGVLNLSSADSLASFSTDFIVDSGAVVSNALGHIDVAGSFTQSPDSLLFFAIDSDTNGMLSATDATFQTNSTIAVDATEAAFVAGTNDVTLVVTSGGITGTNNIVVDADTTGRNVFNSIYLTGGSNLVFRFTTDSLTNYWNATGAFGDFADELDSLITPEMNTIINLIDDPEISSRAVEQTYFTTFNSFQTALQGMRAAVGQSVARGTQLRDQNRMVPHGARGPRRRRAQPESRIRGWGKYYGNYYTHSKSGLYPSYESGLHGGVLGIDTSIEKLIVGISAGASRYETVFDNDARENTTAAHGNLYGTYGAERGYIDGGVAYGQNEVTTRTADPFRLDGEFDAQMVNAYLGGGYDLIDTQGGTVFTPEIAIQYAKYKQDAYTETGTAAVPRVFDKFDADSLLSSVGINIAMQKKRALKTFAFQLDGRLHWMHEFNPDPSNMNFKLAGGSNTYQLDYQSLDEEIYRIGVGCSFFNTGRRNPRNVVFRIDFDELFGDGFNSHNLSAKVTYAF